MLTYVAVDVDKRPGALELSEPLSDVDDFVRTSVYRKIRIGGNCGGRQPGRDLAAGDLAGGMAAQAIDRRRLGESAAVIFRGRSNCEAGTSFPNWRIR